MIRSIFRLSKIFANPSSANYNFMHSQEKFDRKIKISSMIVLAKFEKEKKNSSSRGYVAIRIALTEQSLGRDTLEKAKTRKKKRKARRGKGEKKRRKKRTRRIERGKKRERERGGRIEFDANR